MKKFLLVLVLLAGLVAAALGAFRAGPAPEIRIESAAKAIGRKAAVTVMASEPSRGLSALKVELVQGDKVFPLAEKSYVARPSWAFWGPKTDAESLTLEIGKDAVKDLRQGEAIVRATATRASAWLRSPDPVVVETKLPVRLTPPTLGVVSSFHYVNQGGCEAVVYRVGESAVRDGVRAGRWFFRGWPLPGGGPQDRFALFAVPYDLDDVSGVKVVAEDDAGNEASVGFIDEFFPKPLRRDTIRLNDAFMQKVVAEILPSTPELQDKGDLLENYLQINRDLRKANRALQAELAAASKPTFLWREPFLPMRNTAIMASFADRRTYDYNGKGVDTQDHLGLDMASTRADAVPSANDGVVVLARYFGIYGNAVVVDHGYGLQSLYGHLSSIEVKEGQTVRRGDSVGRSGATGLAGGDHLHFEIALQGLAVSPIEWWDTKWLTDRLKRKLGPALPYGG
ncbi:MAG TPA: M23 family metallopeptidase [Candidatus Polarisedimenticolaceae bacterium]